MVVHDCGALVGEDVNVWPNKWCNNYRFTFLDVLGSIKFNSSIHDAHLHVFGWPNANCSKFDERHDNHSHTSVLILKFVRPVVSETKTTLERFKREVLSESGACFLKTLCNSLVIMDSLCFLFRNCIDYTIGLLEVSLFLFCPETRKV